MAAWCEAGGPSGRTWFSGPCQPGPTMLGAVFRVASSRWAGGRGQGTQLLSAAALRGAGDPRGRPRAWGPRTLPTRTEPGAMPEACPPGLDEGPVHPHCRAPWGRPREQRVRRAGLQPAAAARARTQGPQGTRKRGQHGGGVQGGDHWAQNARGAPGATPTRPAPAGGAGPYTRPESLSLSPPPTHRACP